MYTEKKLYDIEKKKKCFSLEIFYELHCKFVLFTMMSSLTRFEKSRALFACNTRRHTCCRGRVDTLAALTEQYIRCSTIFFQKTVRSLQVHSLTARSLSREYREGLGLRVREKNGRAAQDCSDDSGNGSTKSEDATPAGRVQRL